MKLKSVEIQGFKSFVDRTKLVFHDGITAIVGPNGCGKSNLIDAIRWVLGENNARTLRGAHMEDIIFAGTEYRPPLGMAEVTLTVSTEGGGVPAQYADFAEISVTRRVFRDGDSEYLINKTPCRLKDITDLFMGTGANFYSVIEQGKINTIVSAKPEALRAFIEEAAGITFYKTRKRAALRRIDATHKNLIRVSDILSEISRQIKYLERQAKKAERYRERRDRLRILELNTTHQEMGTLATELTGFEEKKTDFTQQLVGLQSQVETASTDIERLKLDLHEKEQVVQKAQRDLFEAGKNLAEKENQYTYLDKEIGELGDRRSNITTEIERIEIRNKVTVEELENCGSELAELTERNQGYHSELSALEEKKQGIEDQVSELRTRAEELSSKLLEQITVVTTLKNELRSMDQQQNDKQEEQTRWQQEQETLRGELDKYQNERVSILKLQEQLESQWSTSESELGHLENDLTNQKQFVIDTTKKRDELKVELAQTTSKLESILSLERDGNVEQFIARAKAKLGDNLLGRISEFVQVDKEYEFAAEAGLGERLSWIVLREGENAPSRMLQILGDGSSPRATMIPETSFAFAQREDRTSALTGKPGFVAPLKELMRCTEKHRPLVNYLCHNVAVVHDLASASQLANNGFQDLRFVTLSGEVVVPGAETTAGKKGNKEQNVLRLKREIHELQTKALRLEDELRQASTNKDEATAKQAHLEGELEAATERQQNLRLQRVEIEKDLGNNDEHFRRIQQEIERAASQHSQVAGFHAEIREGKESRRQLLAQAEGDLSQLRDQEVELRGEMETTEKLFGEATHDLTQTKVENASFIEREENLNQEQQRLTNEIENLKSSKERLQTEFDQLLGREQSNQETTETLRSEITMLRDQVSSYEESFQSAQRVYQEQQSAVQQRELARRESETTVNEMTRNLSEVEIQLREIEVKRDHLRDLMIEKWKVDLTDAQPDPLLEVTDELRGEADELRAALDKMGEVNLGAVEEHAFLEERFTFLSTQRDDLEESLRKLNQTIRKLDQTTRKMFFEAFDAINKEFKSVFPKLFRGGKAELILTGEEDQDPLERGMTVMAKPPGKRPQHISLLSGGEKSLTAAALVFAIFRYKPAPFSLLDEVDAALDDENTRRLNDIAKDISKKSQLVFITHNKTSMEVAQNLYGITMEEPGVTKIVSVRLDQPEGVQTVKPTEEAAPQESPTDAAVA